MRHLLSGSTWRSIGKLFLLLMMTFALCLGLKVALEAAGNTVGASRPSGLVVLTDTAWSDDFDDASGLSVLEGVQISADDQLILASDALLGLATSVPISPTGEVQAWGRLYFTATVPLSTALAVEVLDATDVPLMHEVPSGGSLAGIDVKVHPALKLQATLSSTAIGQTPRLDEWRVTWIPDYPSHVYLPVAGKSFGVPITLSLGAAVGFTGVNDASPLGKSVRFPSVRKNDAGWDSTFAIQNVTAFATTLTLEFFRQDGSVAYAADGIPLRPYGTYIAALAGFASLEDDTYALAVTATETIAGMASTRYVTGTMAVAYDGVTQGDERIVVPWVYKSYYGWTSRLCVHNMMPGAAAVTITYYSQTGRMYDRRIDLPGNGFDCIHLGQEPVLPSPFVGSAFITSHSNLAVTFDDVQSERNQAVGCLGFDLSAGSNTFYVPRCRKEDGWQTAIQVINVGPSSTTVILTYHEFDGSMSYRITQPLGFSTAFYCPGYAAGIVPPPWPLPYRLGSAVISAYSSPLIALVNEFNNFGTDGFIYAGLPRVSTTAYVPNVGRGFDNWASVLSIQNPNTATNTVAVFFHDLSGGVLYQLSDDLPPHGMGQYNIAQLPGLPDSYEGSAIISATMPVAVLVNKVR